MASLKKTFKLVLVIVVIIVCFSGALFLSAYFANFTPSVQNFDVTLDPLEEAKGKTGVTCPTCGKGEMIERRGRFGIFFSCSNYPECKNAIKARPTGKTCTACGALMMEGTKTIPERCSNKACPNHNPHKLAGAKK